MIRLALRSLTINLAGIYIAAKILSGIVTFGSFNTLFLAALAVAAVNLLVRPVINLLLLPIHLVTLGVFRWVANLATLFIVTRLVPDLQIHAFDFVGMNLTFLIIPPIHFSVFGAFVVVTVVMTVVFHFLYWLLQD